MPSPSMISVLVYGCFRTRYWYHFIALSVRMMSARTAISPTSAAFSAIVMRAIGSAAVRARSRNIHHRSWQPVKVMTPTNTIGTAVTHR